jgi:hypothetical protein
LALAIDEEERRCAVLLARWYLKGRRDVTGQELINALRVPAERSLPLMRRMERMGAVAGVDIYGRSCRLTPAAVDLLTVIEDQTARVKVPPRAAPRAGDPPLATSGVIALLLLAVLAGLAKLVSWVLD